MRDIIWPVALLLVAALIGFGLAQVVGSYNCSNIREETGVPTKFRSFTCYVQVNGQWVPESAWRVER